MIPAHVEEEKGSNHRQSGLMNMDVFKDKSCDESCVVESIGMGSVDGHDGQNKETDQNSIQPSNNQINDTVDQPLPPTYDENGWSSLHWAVWNGDQGLVSSLLQQAGSGVILNEGTTKDVQLETCLKGGTWRDADESKSFDSIGRKEECDNIINERQEKKLEDAGKLSLGGLTGELTVNKERIRSEDIFLCKVDEIAVPESIMKGSNQMEEFSKGKQDVKGEPMKESDAKDKIIIESSEETKKGPVKVSKGSSALHIAVAVNNINIVQRLCEAAADWLKEDNGSYTPLHLATKTNSLNIIQHFLQHGMDVNLTNSNGDTALHTAILFGSNKVARYLLDEPGVDVTIVNRFKKQPLHLAIQTSNTHILQLILDKQQTSSTAALKKDCINPLRFAVMHNNTECAEILLNQSSAQYTGYLLQSATNEDPILHLTAKLGLTKMTSYLLSKGADVSLRSTKRSKYKKGNKTALDVSIDMNFLDITLMLMSAGAVPSTDGSSDGVGNSISSTCSGIGLILNNMEHPEQTSESIQKLLQFGYRFPPGLYKEVKCSSTKDQNAGDSKEAENTICRQRNLVIQMIRDFYKQPLSLYRITANRVLCTLRPSAWRSVQSLPVPAIVKRHITQGLETQPL